MPVHIIPQNAREPDWWENKDLRSEPSQAELYRARKEPPPIRKWESDIALPELPPPPKKAIVFNKTAQENIDAYLSDRKNDFHRSLVVERIFKYPPLKPRPGIMKIRSDLIDRIMLLESVPKPNRKLLGELAEELMSLDKGDNPINQLIFT